MWIVGWCVSLGSALLPDVSARHFTDRAGGVSGQGNTGSKADRSRAAECVSGIPCPTATFDPIYTER